MYDLEKVNVLIIETLTGHPKFTKDGAYAITAVLMQAFAQANLDEVSSQPFPNPAPTDACKCKTPDYDCTAAPKDESGAKSTEGEECACEPSPSADVGTDKVEGGERACEPDFFEQLPSQIAALLGIDQPFTGRLIVKNVEIEIGEISIDIY